jgi:signal transduction histidine kinase
MSALGWCVAAVAGAVATLALAALRRRAVRMARAAHEVRGPLCAALLGLERLAGSDDPLTLAAVELELRRAALAIDELASPRRPAGAAEPVDLGGLLTAAAPGWRALAAAHGARLAVEACPGLVVHGDRLRLAQACGNLVANAVEHGGGDVCVRARALGPAVRVEVTDGGPGLPRPVGALVAGARVRRSRRGHGLAVAARVAARHGGRLAAGPSARGARLVLELPAAGGLQRRAGS